MKKLSGVQIIGMVWYTAEEYDACMAIMSDRAKLHASYHLWRIDAEMAEKRQRRDGKTVVRALINPKEFPAWCRERRLNIDANARNQFAALIAYQIATGGQQSAGEH